MHEWHEHYVQLKQEFGVQCDAYCDWKFGDINVNLSQDVKYTEFFFY